MVCQQNQSILIKLRDTLQMLLGFVPEREFLEHDAVYECLLQRIKDCLEDMDSAVNG